MKSFYLIIGLAILFNGNSQYTLTVNNGYGGGQYPAGAKVHVYANSFPFGKKLFTKWYNPQNISISDSNEWFTIITMPKFNVSITALFDTVNSLNPNANNKGLTEVNIAGDTIFIIATAAFTRFGTATAGYDTTLTPADLAPGTYKVFLQNRNVFYHFPANMTGLVDMYHWTNGTPQSWFENEDKYEFIKDFVYAGIGVLIPNCEERLRDNNNVSPWDINGDGVHRFLQEEKNIRNIQYTKAQLIEFVMKQSDVYMMKKINNILLKNNLITANTCRFSLGFSAGAAFSNTAAFNGNYKASACIGNAGYEVLTLYNTNYKIPTIYAYGENDNYDSATNQYLIKSRINSICAALQLRNVPNANLPIQKSAISANRFTVVKGITINQATTLFNQMIAQGITFEDPATGQVFFKYYGDRTADSVRKLSAYKNLSDAEKQTLENVCFQVCASHNATTYKNKKLIEFFKHSCSNQNANFTRNIKDHKNISIYPNPAKNKISIFSDNKITSLEAYNTQGMLVYSTNANNYNLDLPVTQWKSGFYYFKINHAVKPILVFIQ